MRECRSHITISTVPRMATIITHNTATTWWVAASAVASVAFQEPLRIAPSAAVESVGLQVVVAVFLEEEDNSWEWQEEEEEAAPG